MKLAINVRPYTAKGSSVKGFADVTVNDTMTIHGVQVIEGEKGLFVAMPQTSKPKEENSEEKVYSDLVFPTNAATRGFLSESILDVYFPEGECLTEEPNVLFSAVADAEKASEFLEVQYAKHYDLQIKIDMETGRRIFVQKEDDLLTKSPQKTERKAIEFER